MCVLFFALFLLESLGVSSVHSGRHKKDIEYNNLIPEFDLTLETNITVQLGATAYLPCKINHLGNKTVAWVRNRDAHIISVDKEVFIVDDRFQSLHNSQSQTWTLAIKYVQAKDAGSYECQISSVPKIMQFIHLAIVVPKVRIFGNKEIHVKAGSEVDLKCIISQSVSHPQFVTWYHDTEMITPSNRRFNKNDEQSEETATNTFTIQNAIKSDEGNYTCHPANLHTASVRLHVINGELSEPSIQGNGCRNSISFSLQDILQHLIVIFLGKTFVVLITLTL